MAPTPPVVVRAGPLPAPTAAQVTALAIAAERHDGVAALGEQTLLDLTDPEADVVHLLVVTPDDGPGLVGYATLDRRGATTGTTSAELVVAPWARRRGTGTALLSAMRAAASGTEVPEPAVWAHGHLPGARALAARTGLHVVRELWQMARDLPGDPPPAPPELPPGIVLRPFVVGQDEKAWLALNARAFAGHPEQGRMTLADLRARVAERWFDAGDLLLAERGQQLVASVWLKVDPGAAVGELYALAVEPSAQGIGLGRALTAVTLDRLTGRGLRRGVLYTEAGNAAAVRTYRSAGFTTARVDVQYR